MKTIGPRQMYQSNYYGRKKNILCSINRYKSKLFIFIKRHSVGIISILISPLRCKPPGAFILRKPATQFLQCYYRLWVHKVNISTHLIRFVLDIVVHAYKVPRKTHELRFSLVYYYYDYNFFFLIVI